MNNYDMTPSPQEKTYPSAVTVLAVLAISAVASLLSASFVFMLAAAALSAWLAASAKHPAVSAAVPVISFGVLFLITKSIPDALIPTASVYLIGIICALCTVKKVRLWIGSVLCGAGFALYFAVSFIYLLYSSEQGYMESGSLITASALWWNDMTAAFADNFFAVLETVNTEAELEITRGMLDEMMMQTAVLLPGVISAVFLALGTGVVLLSRVAHKILKTAPRFFPRGRHVSDWSVDVSVSVFFIISTVMAAVFSLLKNTEVVQFAFVNISIAMFLPMLANGIYTFIVRLKAPRPTVTAPDGTPVPRPSKNLMLWILIPMAVINPFMAMLFVAFFGAIEQINDVIAARLQKRQQDKKN